MVVLMIYLRGLSTSLYVSQTFDTTINNDTLLDHYGEIMLKLVGHVNIESTIHLHLHLSTAMIPRRGVIRLLASYSEHAKRF